MPGLDAYIDSHREEIVSSLQELMQVKSVTAPACAPDAPFGEGCRKALDVTLELCRRLGFETVDMDGYIGYADYGCGEEMLGVLAHLDVVPEGEGWSSPAYAAAIVDGKIVGRGALDDKGPAISAIYALAAAKETGLKFRRRVRLLFGCDEESGMRCLDHYNAHERMPDISFSPDAQYPLVNSEKGIYHASIKYEYPSAVRASGGTVVNAVPGSAEAVLPLGAEEVRAQAGCGCFSVENAEGGCTVTAQGTAAHASRPEDGKNAIQLLISLLAKLPLPEADAAAAKALSAAFALEYHGESLGLDCEDESGRLTLNTGTLKWDESGFTLGIDIRSPMMLDEAAISKALGGALTLEGMRLCDITFSKGYCMPEDGELVSSLLRVYRARTGDMTPPKHIGGGTYARHLDNAVAFGPEWEGRDNRVHMVDESIPVDDLILNTKLIADAIAALACE